MIDWAVHARLAALVAGAQNAGAEQLPACQTADVAHLLRASQELHNSVAQKAQEFAMLSEFNTALDVHKDKLEAAAGKDEVTIEELRAKVAELTPAPAGGDAGGGGANEPS